MKFITKTAQILCLTIFFDGYIPIFAKFCFENFNAFAANGTNVR